MKCIILAGGYAKRLLPITENQAKSLLPINGRAMIDFIIEKVDRLEGIDDIIISTNERFLQDFREYVSSVKGRYGKPISIVAEPTKNEKEKMGAIGGIAFVIETLNIEDDVLIISGDNLSDINLNALVDSYYSMDNRAPLIAVYKEKDSEIVKRMSCVELDTDNRVCAFEEKPATPKSNYMSVGFYIYPSETLSMFEDYLAAGNNKDSPGYFLQWLHKVVPVYGFVFEGYWFDIGSFDVYEKVQKFMKNLKDSDVD